MFEEILFEKAGYLLSILLSGGGEYAEIFYEKQKVIRLEYRNSKLDSSSVGIEEGVSLRLIKNGTTFFGFISEPNYESLKELARGLSMSFGQGAVALGLKRLKGKASSEIKLSDISLRERAEKLKLASEYAKEGGIKLEEVFAALTDKSRKILVINSLGEIASDEQERVAFRIQVISKDKEGNLRSAYETAGHTGGFELLKDDVLKNISLSAVRRVSNLINAKPAPLGSMEVVLSASAGGTMIHEAVGHGFEADLVQKGMSIYAGKIGQKVASELISVVDDGTLEGKNGSYNIDDEGVPSQRTVLIDRGVLVGYMYDRLSAIKESRSSTGNGRRQSYMHVPMVRMSNTYILPGETPPGDIFAGIKRGLFVKKMGGGEVNTVTGDFVFEVTEGYLIQSGEISYPVRNALLIGNGPKALMDVEAVGNDLGWAIGMCGKDGQGVPVGDAQPSLRIRSMVVGGSDA
ncbi:MAG: TldD/PmbA family protein [Aquificaceae bacterium]|nr:TldD/PmbA family protein [Aquificaceae bacterium]MDW8237393.1 TldD/PmbA family protein [Aquificaceae bacterium]